MFENRVLRKILGLKRDKVTGSGEDYVTNGLITCNPQQISFGRRNQEE
jgi:hypothetical protein